MTKQRVKKLKEQLNKLGIDAMFVSNPQNIQYLSGYECMVYDLAQKIDDPEVFLLITSNKNFIMSDPRHAGTVANIANFEFVKLPYPTNITNLSKLISELAEGTKVMGFEEGSFLYKELKGIKKNLRVKTVDVSEVVENLRLIKDANELKLLTKAAIITGEGFEYVLSKLRKGMTEKDLAFEITSFFLKNADGNSFNPIVAFGNDSAIPHYEPTDKKIKSSGPLLIDLGCKVEGYCGDMTRTVYIGKAPKEFKDRYKKVLRAQKNCLKNVQAGMSGRKADALARDSLEKTLRDKFAHGTGHGLGLDVHEDPRIRKENENKLKDGMVFTIEPGVYIPGDGGIRIEDVVYLKDRRPVNLTKTPKNLREINLR